MFAYCNNSPVFYVDISGQMARPCDIKYTSNKDETGGGYAIAAGAVVAVGSAILLGPMIEDGISAITDAIAEGYKDVYEYSQTVKAELQEARRKIPHVHRIVPVGSFSNRSNVTINQIREMHQILKDADINRWCDPNNLMLVSAGIHASLHTDYYINHVYSYIKAAEGDKDAIYATLFFLRIEIAAWDTLASGY